MQTFHANKITALMIIVISITIFGACKKPGSIKEGSIPTPKVAARALATPTEKWVDSWAASFLSTTVNGATQAAPSFNKQTFRLNVFSKLGGTQVRVKLTNKFATNTLTVGAAHVALRSTNNSIVATSDRTLTFSGQPGVTLAPGAEIWSDSVTLTVAQHVTVAVSVYIPGSFRPTTFHPTGLHTSYISKTGNFAASTTLPLASFTNTTTEVVMVSGLQVWAPATSKVAIAFGNSITDGAGATNNANGNWPDVLSNRLPTAAVGCSVRGDQHGHRFEPAGGLGPRRAIGRAPFRGRRARPAERRICHPARRHQRYLVPPGHRGNNHQCIRDAGRPGACRGDQGLWRDVASHWQLHQVHGGQ